MKFAIFVLAKTIAAIGILLTVASGLDAAEFPKYDKRLDPYITKNKYNDAVILRNGKAAIDIGYIYNTKLRDYDKALYWYKKAYELGEKGLGASGIGVIYGQYYKKYQEALKWHKIAYENHTDGAACLLGLTYNRLKDYDNAKKWYQIGINNNDLYANRAMGILYHDVYHDKITAGAYYISLIGKYPKKTVIDLIKRDWNLTDEDVKKAYELQLKLDIPKHYTGGID